MEHAAPPTLPDSVERIAEIDFLNSDIRRKEASLPLTGRMRVSILPVGERPVGRMAQGPAWAADAGLWITARHVAGWCSQLRFEASYGRSMLATLHVHPHSDVAAVRENPARRSLPIATEPPELGTSAFSIGYPGGKVGIVHLRLIGQGRAKLPRGAPFRSYVWAIDRYPETETSKELGGMSGSPVLNGLGDAVGVLAYGTSLGGLHWRERVGTVSLSDLRYLVSSSGNRLPRVALSGDSLPSFDQAGMAILASGGVRQIFCST